MSARRFEVLDSWRGICACLVVLHHFQSVSHTYDLRIVRNAYLFVDFFFVLSGFVIAANYTERLRANFGVGRFMLLRFGRLYPLHIFVLGWYLAFEALQLVLPSAGPLMGGAEPFAPPQQSLDTILANVFLVHSLGLFDFLTWNGPSWSISTEFYTYLAFGVAVLAFRRRGWIPVSLAAIGGPIIIAVYSETGMDATYQLGIVRCLYGFGVGVLCFEIWRRLEPRLGSLAGHSRIATLAEAAVVAMVLLLVHLAKAGGVEIAAPYVFALTILVFSGEAGWLSRMLHARPLLLCGALSYSIYMTHHFIQLRLVNVAQLLESRFDLTLLTHVENAGRQGLMLGIEPWQGDLALVAMLLLVIATSYVTYQLVEVPARRWFQRLAKRPAKSAQPEGAAALQRDPVTGR